MPVDIEFYASIVSALFFSRKIAGRQFPPLAMVLDALAAQAVPRTIGIGTGTAFGVYLQTGASFLFVTHNCILHNLMLDAGTMGGGGHNRCMGRLPEFIQSFECSL
jgi:hypothetical protein